MPITARVASILFVLVILVLSIAFVSTVVIPPIVYLFATVGKALLLALIGA